MKNLLYIPFMLLLLSCGAKTATTQPAAVSAHEQATYEVLNFCLQSKQIAAKTRVLEDEAGTTYDLDNAVSLARMDSLVSSEDVMAIYLQHNDTVAFKIDRSKLVRPVKMASSQMLVQWLKESRRNGGLEAYWDMVYQEYGQGYVALSKPLFSKDYTVAIIAYGYHCGGLCGNGSTFILKKGPDGAWQIAAKTDSWIS